MPKLIISNKELASALIGETPTFPKYSSPLMNLANRFAQGTVPKMVGQLSELIQECPHGEYDKWREWYLKKHPESIDRATDKIYEKIQTFKEVVNTIDKKMIREWVEDLVINKTFTGLKFQRIILERVSKMEGKSFRLAKPNEESKGIDGYIGDEPVSIKPITYKEKPELLDRIDSRIIFYNKTKTGITIEL